MIGAINSKDAVITAYRCHGWTYLMGANLAEVLSELTGILCTYIFYEFLKKFRTYFGKCLW